MNIDQLILLEGEITSSDDESGSEEKYNELVEWSDREYERYLDGNDTSFSEY